MLAAMVAMTLALGVVPVVAQTPPAANTTAAARANKSVEAPGP